MFPYYRCPFTSDTRKSMNIPEMLPMTTPNMPINEPVTPMAYPVQPMYPMQQPVGTMMQQQQMMTICPCQYHQYAPFMGGLGNVTEMDITNTTEDIINGDIEGIDDISPDRARPNDPPPVLSNNPVVTNITVFKELTGYPRYGNPSNNADILYTGNRGAWTFDVPPNLLSQGNFRVQLIIRAVLDDHPNVAENRYSANISINGDTVHTGALRLDHGTPAGGTFTNWRSLTFNVRNLRRNNRVVIVNTSTAGPNDWIAFDWMELRFLPR